MGKLAHQLPTDTPDESDLPDPAEVGVIVDDDAIMLGGKRIGFVAEGRNGGWFAYPPSREMWADPLQGIDDGPGFSSALAAAVAFATA